MNRWLRWRWLGLAALMSVALGSAATITWLHSSLRGLPYRDSFARGRADQWRAFGGDWELVHGMMRNDSDERGAKLLTGSPYWRNYSVEADVYLLGDSGDAGLIIRSSDEEEGVNAYSGYYAGVRTIDNSLVLGRADHGWMETSRQVPVADGIRPFRWYHLKLLAYGCRIVAAVTAPGDAFRSSLDIDDTVCIRSGRIGLRSYSAGGVWRNVVVRPATRQDLLAMLRESQEESTSPNSPEVHSSLPGPSRTSEEAEAKALAGGNTSTIASLRFRFFPKPTVATIRGVVVLTTPRLYVEDATGGAYVENPRGPLLKVGDEVQVSGDVSPGEFSPTLHHARVRVLWERSPMPPLSVTAAQASTGKYDATFIEMQGLLTGWEHGPGNALALDLEDGPQSFRAILNPGRSDSLFAHLRRDSMLRVRGICVVDPALTRSLTPFVLLLRSGEDIDVIAGPPWWSARHVLAMAVVVFLLSIAAVALYHRAENWRLRAILEERARLAHEMHDTLAQSFAGIGFQLQAIRNGLPDGMPALSQQLDFASQLVRHSHEEARRSLVTLHSEELQCQDVLAALDQCARRMVEGSTVQVISRREGDLRSIPLRIADPLYRIGQEAVANAVRHADPSMLTLRLAFSGDSVSLNIEDNGAGFVPGNGLHGFGIRGMRRRAHGISAAFSLRSRPGAGTRIRVDAPLPPRFGFAALPGFLWKIMTEHRTDVRETAADSHLYRG